MIDLPIVRVLYGDVLAKPKLMREVRSSFKTPWAKEEIEYFVLGEENFKLLAQLGAKRVRLVDKAPCVSGPQINHYYNKTWLMDQASRAFAEFVYLDFDCRCLKDPDVGMCEVLRCTGKTFMAPCVQYVRPVVKDLLRLRLGKQRFHLSSAALYCSQPEFIRKWLRAYDLMLETWNVHDEAPLMFSIDSQFGLLDRQQLVDEFELPVAKFRRSIELARAQPKDVYFYHR